jgi:hypothetical protein
VTGGHSGPVAAPVLEQESERGVQRARLAEPEREGLTVMSGVFYFGVGERFDGRTLGAYPPGAVIVLPGGTHANTCDPVRSALAGLGNPAAASHTRRLRRAGKPRWVGGGRGASMGRTPVPGNPKKCP